MESWCFPHVMSTLKITVRLTPGLFITTSVFSIKLRLKNFIHSKGSSSRELLNMLLLDVCEQLIRTV